MENPDHRLDLRLAALADPTRRMILARLAQGEASVAQIAAPLAISQPAVSRHLKVLEQAGLIETRVAGTTRPRRLTPGATDEIWDSLSEFRVHLSARYDRMDAILKEQNDGTDDGQAGG